MSKVLDQAASAEDPTPTGSDETDDREARPTVHRLRELDRSGRVTAALVGAALLVAPLVALIHYLPNWVPSQDPAMMALRALDVGTSRTPFVGQPSLAHLYIDGHTVNHLGATHFYVLAPFVRLLGAQAGMLVVSVLITGTCVLIAAWAVFRQLGATAGVLAAVILGAITYTTGMSSLANPVSSNIAGYPLLASTVLLWCLLCGDLRLLPLTTAVVTFTAQQHLSVLPMTSTVAAVGVVGLVVALFRRPAERRPGRREVVRWVGLSGVVVGVLWLPVLIQQVLGDAPNLTRLAQFAGNDDRPTLGYSAAVRQVAHVLGLPPVLGKDNINAHWLNEGVPVTTWLTAGLAVAVIGVAAIRWRGSQPRRSVLVVMAGAVAVGGLANGASVPTGTYETYRLAFYHWMFPLTFFVTLTLALVVATGIGRFVPRGPDARRWLRGGLIGLAVVAIAVPALVNVTQDRWLNTLLAAFSPIDRQTVDELADEVMDHRDQLDGPVVLIARGQSRVWGFHQALALALEERGLRVEQPSYEGLFVSNERLADRSTVRTGLVLVLDTRTVDLDGLTLPTSADTIADVGLPEDFERQAFDSLGRLPEQPRRLRVFALDRDQLLAWATDDELDRS